MINDNKESDRLKQLALGELPALFQDRDKDAQQRTCAAVSWMRENRYMGIVAPKSHGGASAGISDVCNVLSVISSISGSLGLIYAMHLSQTLSLVNHRGKNEFLNAYLRNLCEDQHLIASATSEKGSGGDILTSICKVRARGEKLELQKEVPNISYVNLADALLVTALHHEEENRQILALIRVEDATVTPGFTGSFIGMSGIHNASYTIEASFTQDAIFEENYPTIARTTMTAATQLMWAAVWSGIATSAIEKAKNFIKKELKHSKETTTQMNHVLSELLNRQYTLNSLIAASILEYNDSGEAQVGLQASARINRLKITASQLVNEICYDNASIERFVDESLNLD